jgi:hypothetical protein
MHVPKKIETLNMMFTFIYKSIKIMQLNGEGHHASYQKRPPVKKIVKKDPLSVAASLTN